MVKVILYLILGLFSGTISGVVGIGGGVIIVPSLIFLFGFTQQQAQGTTLALLVPPIGLLAAYTYYTKGLVDVKVASLICIGFFIGGLLGSKIAINLSNEILRKIFGSIIILIGLYMLVKK
ncbi:MAG: sulfite exporter TauE/SafE family protein [Spirochaetales bacterium]|nr:sulfite exporter TauE/SafE family protein [Spirochaetales bacterium]